MTWWRGGDAEPLQQLVGALLAPHEAVAHDVVGRRTPTADSSRPVSALKVEDLPEPVAPRERDHGVLGGQLEPARGAGGHGGGVVDHGVVDPTARRLGGALESLDARADVRAPGDQLLGPFEQGRHRFLTVRVVLLCAPNPRAWSSGSTPASSAPPLGRGAKRRSSTLRAAARMRSGVSGETSMVSSRSV